MSNQDLLYRYLFEEYEVRGELVQLDHTYRHVVEAQNYPVQVQKLLGELLVATSLLTATLKFEGSITVQLQGDGPVRLAVINGDNNQQLRGVARYEGELPSDGKLQSLIGNGQLIITITPEQGERYQGIIALDADTLAGCLEHYFARSEQLATKLWIPHRLSRRCAARCRHHAAGAARPERGSQQRFRSPDPAHQHHQG